MTGPKHKPVSLYLWTGLAMLSCPCHLPIVAAVLAGTTAGGLLSKHWGLAALVLSGLFVVSLISFTYIWTGANRWKDATTKS